MPTVGWIASFAASSGDLLSMPACCSTYASPAFWPISVPTSVASVSGTVLAHGLITDPLVAWRNASVAAVRPSMREARSPMGRPMPETSLPPAYVPTASPSPSIAAVFRAASSATSSGTPA
jgi:hypothetical protein